MKKQVIKILSFLIIIAGALAICFACDDTKTIPNEPAPHKHYYTSKWTITETHHYQKATCEHETEIRNYGEHNLIDNFCKTCGYYLTTENLAYEYNELSDSYTVIGFNESNSTNVIVPETYNDKPVTKIGREAFKDCAQITRVILPDSVTEIGYQAFFGCSNLLFVKLGNNIKLIYETAFEYCYKLHAVILYDSYGFKFYSAFSKYSQTGMECYNNYSEYVYNCKEDEKGFILRKKTLICYVGNDSDITIPDSITKIANYSFSDNKTIKTVTMSDNVISIGVGAFSNCENLKTVKLSDKITAIPDSAFLNCGKLESVNIGPKVDKIRNKAFYNCVSLKNITLPKPLTVIDMYAFYNCGFENITVHEENSKYSSIDGNLYSKDGKTLILYALGKKATEYTIPNTVTHMGEGAFMSSKNLVSVIVPNSIIEISRSAFKDCAELKTVTISSSVKKINSHAFYGCENLTEVYFNHNAPSHNKYWLATPYYDTGSVGTLLDVTNAKQNAINLTTTYSYCIWEKF